MNNFNISGRLILEWLHLCFLVNTFVEGRANFHSAIQDGVMYKFYNDNITSWLDGQRQCIKEGGHLVSLETDRKWKFIKEEIQNLCNPEDNEWFIGLNRSSKNSNWTWVTGKPLTNPHWQNGEPSGDGLCVVIAKQYPEKTRGHFNDLNCNTKKGFICEEQISFTESDKVFYERWLKIPGNKIKALTTNLAFQKAADKSGYISRFRHQIFGKDYGARYRSYLLAKETGMYTFYTFCDDTCQLFISGDLNPREKKMIINQTTNVGDANQNCCNDSTLQPFQVSTPQFLRQNKLYYIEALLKQGVGYDRMSIGMKMPNGTMVLPIGKDFLMKNITKDYVPEGYCRIGNPNYPDYVKCTKLLIDATVSLLKDLRYQVESAPNTTSDFLQRIMKVAGENTSELLQSLNDSLVKQSVTQSNQVFDVAREVEKLGESIASRITTFSTVIAVNSSSLVMKASYGRQNFLFNGAEKPGLEDNIKITLPISTNKAHFFSAFYKNLDKLIQNNISEIHTSDSNVLQRTPHRLNSKIMSGSVFRPGNKSLEYNVTIRLEHTQFMTTDKMTMVCAFWRYADSFSNSTGYWSTEGCHKDKQMSSDRATVCHCNHLTHFAVLMRVTDDKQVDHPSDEGHTRALEIITYVGCSLSLLGEILTIVTLIGLKLMRSETSIIHLNLVSALAVAQIIFLTGIEATQNKAACKTVAVFLHYFNLVSFTWMLVEGIWLYLMIVKVFESGHSRMKKYCASAWGIPFVFVVITFSASFDGYGTDRSCWLSVQKGTIWSFVVPVLLIAVANSIILGMVVREILRLNHPTTTEATKYQSARSGVQSAIVLLPLLGITWIFGVLTFNSETLAFQYLFAIFSSLQGFFIFLFHCLLNSEVRRVFHRKKKIWSETHDLFHTHSLSPPNYNDLSKGTVSTRNGSLRPGSSGSAMSHPSQKPL